MDSSPKLVLAYWGGIRGRVQPIRYLLEYLGLPYEEKLYPLDNFQEWFEKDKPNIPSDFANLPYLKDGDKVITETEIILRYLCKKANRKDLLGKDSDEKMIIGTTRWVIQDIFATIAIIAYSEDFEKKTDQMMPQQLAKVAQLSKFLGQKEFLHEHITYVDFLLYEVLELLSAFKPDTLDQYSNLKEYQKRFAEQKFMKDYIASGRFIRRPFYGFAFWNPME